MYRKNVENAAKRPRVELTSVGEDDVAREKKYPEPLASALRESYRFVNMESLREFK